MGNRHNRQKHPTHTSASSPVPNPARSKPPSQTTQTPARSNQPPQTTQIPPRSKPPSQATTSVARSSHCILPEVSKMNLQTVHFRNFHVTGGTTKKTTKTLRPCHIGSFHILTFHSPGQSFHIIPLHIDEQYRNRNGNTYRARRKAGIPVINILFL